MKDDLWVNSAVESDAYTSVNYATIGSDNGFSPVWCQAIIWTNASLLPVLPPPWTNFCEIQNNIFIQENAFANVIW